MSADVRTEVLFEEAQVTSIAHNIRIFYEHEFFRGQSGGFPTLAGRLTGRG